MVRRVNVKKTKSSKKIILKITMSMTMGAFLGRNGRKHLRDNEG